MLCKLGDGLIECNIAGGGAKEGEEVEGSEELELEDEDDKLIV